MFIIDVAMTGVGYACPVCGIVYGSARLALDYAGIDLADMADGGYSRKLNSDYVTSSYLSGGGIR